MTERKVVGNFSTLNIGVTLTRHISQFVVDYYIPSSMLVTMSWVSFWLEPSAIPGRTTLGTASWLTFITLNRAVNSEVSHVGYIKFIDVWFLACTSFIFASLFEFALVNVIFRSANWVMIPRRGGAAILREGLREVSRSAFTTPSLRRKNSSADEKERGEAGKKEKEFEEELGRKEQSNHEKGPWLQVKNQHHNNTCNKLLPRATRLRLNQWCLCPLPHLPDITHRLEGEARES